MDPCIPIPIPDKQLEDLVEKAKDYALMHGICMRQKDKFDRDALHFAPFVLFPTPFPRDEYNKSLRLQPILNELMHKVAHDYDFLKESLKHTIKVDEFTGRLWNIYETIMSEGGPTQEVDVGLFRSDYFYCCSNKCIKQVEFNTIASSFGCVTSKLVQAHKYVVAEAGHRELLKDIPDNGALEGLSEGLIEAWKIYNKPNSVIMILVEDVTYNICDQKFHEFEIRRQCPDVFVIRKTLTELASRAEMKDDKSLWIDGQEVAVIYMRCGYHPDQYPTEKEWEVRLMMERSLAIKSPSIHYHLAGTKKVQQELAKPGQVEKFLGDKAQIDEVRDIFTGLYSLDHDEAGDKAYAAAIANPEKYVLKPQREGGGNNVYGADIKPFLENIKDSEERNAFILMDRIQPPVTTNYMVRPGQNAKLVDVISELGIFGYVIGDKNTIHTNKHVGQMLRTKLSHVDEGGVAAGLGALDSVYLVDAGRCCMK
eukprot:TRINITY_DN4569_c0_g1_i2.p1 TRINITY_DN4569_c0_g1~~TRINITY_DN4569_c0_g1_i2.p1  ORF type:complete len:481 (-),score=128.38 TRINITY_DN4569_c0_g1_i2:814-2256(-)